MMTRRKGISSFAKLFSTNPVDFEMSLLALCKRKCAKSSRRHLRRMRSWLKKNTMHMAKWRKRKHIAARNPIEEKKVSARALG